MTEHVVISGTLHIATKDGEAMFFHDSIDFGQYAGTDGGWTKYRLEFEDAAGKKAWAYAGDRGGGEALGSELVTNGDFSAWVGDNPVGWAVYGPETGTNYITESAGKCRIISDSGSIGMIQLISFIAGRLYKRLVNVDSISGVGFKVLNLFVSSLLSDSRYTTIGNKGFIRTATTDDRMNVSRTELGISDSTIGNITVKPYTDIPTTGLHLLSAQNGSTRNMESVESGFNPNTVVLVTVTQVGYGIIMRGSAVKGITIRG